MENFDEIYDRQPSQVDASRVCEALHQSLPAFSQELVDLLDDQQLDRSTLMEAYVRFAVPTSILSRAILEQMDEHEELRFPGLQGIVAGCPDLDQQLNLYVESPERELLLRLAEIWMGVRHSCEEMLAALQGA